MDRFWKIRVGDATLYASPIYVGRGRLLFARLIGGDQEARALRKALREGFRAAIYAPWSAIPDYVSLDPASRLRTEAIWVQGLPRSRVTLYLPVFREGEQTWYFFLPAADPVAELGDFVEAVTPYPAPSLSDLPPARRDLNRLLRSRDALFIPARDNPEGSPQGVLMEDATLREVLADLSR